MRSSVNTFTSCRFIRERVLSGGGKLSASRKLLSLVVYFVASYALPKLKKISIQQNNTRLKKLITVFELVDFGIRARYLFDPKARFYSIYYLLMCNKVVYGSPMRLQSQGWFQSIASSYWIFIAFFLFKALEWNFNRQVQQEIRLDTIKDAVEAPKVQEVVRNRLNICPLCDKRVNIPAIVPTSNFAYCFECISNYVDARRVCPMSKLPLELEDVRRIYIN